MTNKLEELFKISSKYDYEFHYKIIEEKENSFHVDEENKIVEAKIGDHEDKGLPKLIDEIIEKIRTTV
jgi:hypothetical protein